MSDLPAQQLWWTTSNGSVFLPTRTDSSSAESTSSKQSTTKSDTSSVTYIPGSQTSVVSSTTSGSESSSFTTSLSSGQVLTSFTTSVPVTITSPSTTYTSYSQSVVTTVSSAFDTSPSSFASSQSICAGDGVDASAAGLLSALVIPSVIGLLIWLLFAILRPHFRQVYGLREWFVQQDLRPEPLGSSPFAFLFPHVPLVPAVPTDVSDAGKSPQGDSQLFPSDEQISQRALWISFLIVVGWSVLALAGVLPLYLVSTPCLAQSPPPSAQGGGYSTLNDLSLLRLLRLLDNQSITTTSNVQRRAIVNGNDVSSNIRIRIIVLTILVIVLGCIPALWKLMREFNRLVAHRQRWIDVKCEGVEMGWLSAKKAPGFTGWGEKRLKDFITKIGMSSSLDTNGTRRRRDDANRSNSSPSHGEGTNTDIDIQALFTIGGTHQLALLIDERDEILENLEVAETRYISSFRLTTPDPSLPGYQSISISDPDRPEISRPFPLSNNVKSRKHRRQRSLNPAHAASSLAPTNFVAPSQYYKLQSIHGANGGRFASSSSSQALNSRNHNDFRRPEPQRTLSDAIHSRVIGSRFQEVNRNSRIFGQLPIGSPLRVGKDTGELGPLTPTASNFNFEHDEPFDTTSIPDPRQFGPNYDDSLEDLAEDEEWVDISKEGRPSGEFASEDNGGPDAGPSSFKRTFQKHRTSSSPQGSSPRPKLNKERSNEGDDENTTSPSQLRLPHTTPFVRPMSGVDYNALGDIYADIRLWRSRLKAINIQIAEAQEAAYQAIADGEDVKGWLLVGRGLRFIHGMELIEGRAKEDVRWDVLQNERSLLDNLVTWSIVGVAALLLVIGLTAVSGLALSGAPDFAHYLPFLRDVSQRNDLAGGIATVLTPAVAATVFIALALYIIHWAVNVRGTASVSSSQLLVFKVTFYILVSIAAIWLIAVGAIMFAIRSFDSGLDESSTTANGSIYMTVLVLAMVFNVAIIVPGLLLLQPRRLWKVWKAEKTAITPRQRFRAVYPRTYDPGYATAACVLAIIFASTFALIFPLIAPAVVLLLFLSLIAHRFLVGYVYGRTHSQSGGAVQIWLLRRFGTLLSLQPLLLGLILLSRRLWAEAGVLLGAALVIIVFVESYTSLKTRLPGRSSLSPIARNSLESFEDVARDRTRKTRNKGDEAASFVSGSSGVGGRGGSNGGPGRRRTRGSMASVLEMMSLTLAVMPSTTRKRGPVPLQTETLDDLTATERAARTHPDAPPHLPPLSFADHAEEMAGILYAPELIAPSPIIWLPKDSAGVAKSEALDLQKYHDLRVTLDVRSKEDVLTGRRLA